MAVDDGTPPANPNQFTNPAEMHAAESVPAPPAPSIPSANISLIDMAYVSYGFLALVAMYFASVSTFVNEGLDQAGYLMLGMVFIIPGLAASGATVVLTLMRWRNLPLVVLFVVQVILVSPMVFLSTEGTNLGAWSLTAMNTLLWSYVVIFLHVPIRWFARGRRLHREKAKRL